MEEPESHAFWARLHQIQSYKVNKALWFKGEFVALMLEYEHPSEAVEKYVQEEGQMRFREISLLIETGDTISHPDTIFINYLGILDLMDKSPMPLPRQLRRDIIRIIFAPFVENFMFKKERDATEGNENDSNIERNVQNSNKKIKIQNSILNYLEKK